MMCALAIAFGSATTMLLPSAFAAAAAAAPAAPSIMKNSKDCYGKICDPIEEYCSAFQTACDKCSNICDTTSHNHHADTCDSECAEYKKFDPLQADIHAIKTQQRIILILIIILLAIVIIRYAYKCFRYMRNKRCFTQILKKFHLKKANVTPAVNSKDAVTIQNVMTVNETERVPSQIYSLTGVEGSVMTMTTPVSTRWPAENSTTPTTISAEYSYDNQALVVTPIAEKPGGTQTF